MDLDDYQATTKTTENSRMSRWERLASASMGLAGEAGEVIDPLKKHLFHGHDLNVAEVAEELGDTLCYIAFIARYLGLSLNEIAEMNIKKRQARYPQGFSHEASRNRGEKK